MKNAAFIPLRGGSVSIPLKNIKPLFGRPLAYYVIDAADACPEIDTIVISTDSPIIKECVLKHPSKKLMVISRSPEVSTAEASTEATILEFAQNYPCENVILIQATSPLLRAEHLSGGFAKMAEGCDTVLSVVRQHRFLWDESGKPLNYQPQKRPRRQEWDGILVENGAFYISPHRALLQSECRLSGRIGVYEMPAETYVELDDPFDWLFAESLLKKRAFERPAPDIKPIKMFLTDCDGTLTDSGMYYSEKGEELKKFNTRDGHAFQMLNEAGLITGIITGEKSPIVAARGAKIQAAEIHLGVQDKLTHVSRLAQKHGLSLGQVAYVGDDSNDLALMRAVGFAACPADAVSDIKACAHYVSPLKGGEGAVRDAAEYFLRHRQ